MSWLDYYRLLVIYKGDLTKASEGEINYARLSCGDNYEAALKEAREKYETTKPRMDEDNA